MVKNSMVLLLISLLIPCTATAANLYLKNGGIIECILAKQHGKTVYVLVNKFTEVDLDSSEVDIKKTFNSKQLIRSYRHHKNKARHNR